MMKGGDYMTELFISFTDGEGEIHIMAEGSIRNIDNLDIKFRDGFVFVHDLDGQTVVYNKDIIRSMTLHYNKN